MLEISEPGDKIGEKLLMLLNARQRQVWVGGQVVELTAEEFDIYHHLCFDFCPKNYQ